MQVVLAGGRVVFWVHQWKMELYLLYVATVIRIEKVVLKVCLVVSVAPSKPVFDDMFDMQEDGLFLGHDHRDEAF